MNIREVQTRLAALGFDPGPVDGIAGAKTRSAVRSFQTSRGLLADGIVGPATAAALNAEALRSDGGAAELPPVLDGGPALPWFETAKSLLGLKEGPGAQDNPTILDWAESLDAAYPHDSIAWCGLFVAHCLGSTLPNEPLPANPLGARNYLNVGMTCEPQVGAILVFWRGSKAGWQGHVGFHAGERSDAYKVLGGNQSDSVSYAWIAKNRLLGARWPKTAPFLKTGKGQGGAGALSTNEA